MTDTACLQLFRDLPRIDLTEDGPMNIQFSQLRSPQLNPHYDPVDKAPDGSLHLSTIERVAYGYGPSYPPLEDPHESPYTPCNPCLDGQWESHETYMNPFPAPRYPSPWGCDTTATITENDSNRSEISWSPESNWSPVVNGLSLPESLSYMSEYPLPLSMSAADHAVIPRDLQHIPDEPESSPVEEVKTEHEYIDHPDHGTLYAPAYESHSESSSIDLAPKEEDDDQSSDYRPSKPAKYSNRDRSSRSRWHANGQSHRVSKRVGKRGSKHGTISKAAAKAAANAAQNGGRVFVCSFSHYGCRSTFTSKNEWKRHVASQHLQLGFFRCDVGQCNTNIQGIQGIQGIQTHGHGHAPPRGPNDFNRKDLFTQHQRRMHAPWTTSKPPSSPIKDKFEAGLEAVRQRCWRQKRQAPQRSACGFCAQVFSGSRSWEERMEHVGKHYERGERDEHEDEQLRHWALCNGVILPTERGRYILASLKPEGVYSSDDEDAEGDYE